jgi:MiaB-like tRNA modifying enzyme
MNIYLESYGCTANKSDTYLIISLLKKRSHKIVKEMENADIIIINTCTVINTTEQKMISRLKKFKKNNKKVIVTGCMASIQKDLIKSIISDVKFLDPKYSYNINDIIENKELSINKKNKTSYSKKYDNIVAPISISEGCKFSCSYCITTMARGELNSFPMKEIIKNVKSAITQNCKEIQITAQDTSSYGLDKNNSNYDLGILLNNLGKLEGDYRIRVGMMNPFTLKQNIDSIINGYDNQKIYKFLHLPIQSGDNDILQKMNRKYKSEDYQIIINKFRNKFSNISISTDIIVGFPTESDKQFKNSIDIIKKLHPDIVNITRYSARPLTKAKKMKGRIDTNIVKNRSKKLSELCKIISYENNKKFIGNKFKILITEKGKNNTFIGRNDNYKPIILKENVKIGSFIDTEITEISPTYLVGTLI